MINISQQVAMFPDLVDRIINLANNIKFAFSMMSFSYLTEYDWFTLVFIFYLW